MPKRTATALLFVLLTAAALPQISVETARTRMAAVKIFAFGGVGFAGVTSQGELLFDEMMSQPHARAMEDLETLYATGNPQARAYALAGIRKLDRPRFQLMLPSARASTESVKTMSGCVIETRSLRAVADDLNAARYDLWLYRKYDNGKSPPRQSSSPSLGGSIHK